MKFRLVDSIIELTRGERIVAVKAVSLAEEYLADHFPTFPVLPGVLMLEALVESAAWLVRDAQNFTQSLVLLQNARNVTYRNFVKPGNLIRLEVACRRLAHGDSDFEGIGYCNQTEVIKARFGLMHFSLQDHQPSLAHLDRRMIDDAQARFAVLRR